MKDVYSSYEYDGIISTEKTSEWTREQLDEQLAKAVNPEVFEASKVIPTESLRREFLVQGDRQQMAFSIQASDQNVLDLMERENLLSSTERKSLEDTVAERQTAARKAKEAAHPAAVSAAHEAQMPKLYKAANRIAKKLQAAKSEVPAYASQIDEIATLAAEASTITDYMSLYDTVRKIKNMWKRIPVKRH